jgi:hypothetical protein
MAGQSRAIPLAELKKSVLASIANGETVADAVARVGRSISTYEQWRRKDAQFAGRVDELRGRRSEAREAQRSESAEMEFHEFSSKYLGVTVFPHMQNVVDIMEGREPAWKPPGIVWEPGERDLAIVNMPPEHGKSMTLTINYVTYRVALDPNIRIIIVSKTQAMSRKFLYAIKTRLTHPRYAEMHAAYSPAGGFEGTDASWTQDLIYVSSEGRDSGEKDPTIQALGIRGHVYGARADIVILDDCVDMTNAHEYEKQIDWIQAEVMSRLSNNGMLLAVGTRLSSKDLYVELRQPSRYPDEESPWSYLSMPAVLDMRDDPKDWVTLWPKTNIHEVTAKGKDMEPDKDGFFPKWDGPRLAKKRSRMSPRTWAMVYMQQQVSDDAVFHPDAVRAAINGNRLAGIIPRGMVNCRPNGMDGLIVVAGLDPAMAGHTSAVCVGLDPVTQKRYVLDVFNRPGQTPDQIREMIYDFTSKYSVGEWRVEKNAFQSMLTQDREVREYLAASGSILREHFTGANKHDSDFGVASMTTLFGGWKDKLQVIELPSTHASEATKALVEQLVTWHPAAPKTQKTDCVMALWFAELACRDRIASMSGYSRSHVRNIFATRWDVSNRTTVNLSEIERDTIFIGA